MSLNEFVVIKLLIGKIVNILATFLLRLGMYKKPGRRSHLTDRSSRAGHLENLRKSKRGAGTIQNRGIDINEGKYFFSSLGVSSLLY